MHQNTGDDANDVTLQTAIELFAANQIVQSFRLALQVLSADFDNFGAQALALRILNRTVGNGFRPAVKEWIDACRFGNLDNAAIIVPGISDDDDEIYVLCSRFASVCFRLDQPELGIRVFSHCLTAHLPSPQPLADTAAFYRRVADSYDDDPIHHLSVDEFTAFIHRHLASHAPYDIIDAPCGTGLLGPAVRPLAGSLVGCDLSSDMVAKAQGRGCYDRLIVGELTETLKLVTGDLVACHGSLHHFPDLARVSAAVATALAAGGWFAFSDVPAPTGVMVTIGGSLRYARSADHVRNVLGGDGFEYVASQPALCYGLPCLYWLFRKSR